MEAARGAGAARIPGVIQGADHAGASRLRFRFPGASGRRNAGAGDSLTMCRSIKVLRRPDQATTAEELNAAALQFVRKISGFSKPSKTNQETFERAVAEVAASSRRLLDGLSKPSPAPPPPTASEPGNSAAEHPPRARRSPDAAGASAPGSPPDRRPA